MYTYNMYSSSSDISGVCSNRSMIATLIGEKKKTLKRTPKKGSEKQEDELTNCCNNNCASEKGKCCGETKSKNETTRYRHFPFKVKCARASAPGTQTINKLQVAAAKRGQKWRG